MAEVNPEIGFMLGVFCIAAVLMPLIYNLTELITEFTPERSHNAINFVSSIFHYGALVTALLAISYIYYLTDGAFGIIRFS